MKMRITNRHRAAILMAVCAWVLSGCATVESITGRSQTFNEFCTDAAWTKWETKIRNDQRIMQVLTPIIGQTNKSLAEIVEGEVVKRQQQKLASAKAGARGNLPKKALDRIVDKAADHFVQKLTVGSSEYQLVMVVGDLTTSATGAGQPALQSALNDLAEELRRNPKLAEDFIFLQMSSEAASKVIADTSGDASVFDDPYSDTVGDQGVVKYHPDYVYQLNAEMSEHDEITNWRKTYGVRFNVMKPRERKTVQSIKHQQVMRYHPTMGWITDERDQALACP